MNWRRIITNAGAFVALLIGSGFATGQEVMQYFSSYGLWGILGVIVVFLLFLFVGTSFISVGYREKFDKGNEIYAYYSGPIIGKFYDYFSILFLYMSYIVMVGGAGASLNQQFNVPYWLGGTIMGLLTIITVILGLSKIVDVIGNIGPVIIALALILGLISIFTSPVSITEAHAALENIEVLQASTNWLFSALSYVGFCMLWLAAFLNQMGKNETNIKEARLSTIIGAAAFSISLVIVALGILANIQTVSGSQIPLLVLADRVSPIMGLIFIVIVFAGIFTTSVPLLWQVVARFSEDGSNRFRILTIALAVIGTILGLAVPFDQLVNVVYVINGYVGIFLIIFMIVKSIRDRRI